MKRQLLSHRFARASAPAIQARLVESQRARVAEFERSLAESKLTSAHQPCPCGASDDVLVSEVDRYGLPLTNVLCMKCGTIRIDPYLDAESLDKFYREMYLAIYGWAPVLADYFARQASYGECVLALFERELPMPANVLEIGCGAGGALSVFQDRGHRVAGCAKPSLRVIVDRANGHIRLSQNRLRSGCSAYSRFGG